MKVSIIMNFKFEYPCQLPKLDVLKSQLGMRNDLIKYAIYSTIVSQRDYVFTDHILMNSK